MKIVPFRSSRDQDDVSRFLLERAGPIARGVLWMLTIALLFYGLSRAERLARKLDEKLDGIASAVGKATDSDDLARTRYETLIRETHEIQVKLDYLAALYQDDVRRGIEPQLKEK